MCIIRRICRVADLWWSPGRRARRNEGHPCGPTTAAAVRGMTNATTTLSRGLLVGFGWLLGVPYPDTARAVGPGLLVVRLEDVVEEGLRRGYVGAEVEVVADAVTVPLGCGEERVLARRAGCWIRGRGRGDRIRTSPRRPGASEPRALPRSADRRRRPRGVGGARSLRRHSSPRRPASRLGCVIARIAVSEDGNGGRRPCPRVVQCHT